MWRRLDGCHLPPMLLLWPQVHREEKWYRRSAIITPCISIHISVFLDLSAIIEQFFLVWLYVDAKQKLIRIVCQSVPTHFSHTVRPKLTKVKNSTGNSNYHAGALSAIQGLLGGMHSSKSGMPSKSVDVAFTLNWNKHCKNCECCPVSLLTVRPQRLSCIQVLNCQNCNQCLKCHKSPGLSFQLSKW